MNEPTGGLASWQSVKIVKAGQITEVVPAGCYVKDADGSAVFREFLDGMTVRYQPVVGDYWVVYEPDGYQSISPRAVFEGGYVSRGPHPRPSIEELERILSSNDSMKVEILPDGSIAAISNGNGATP